MSDREHAEDLLEAARRDLRALRAMTDSGAFPDEIFGFHAQQAVEKALKSWLASRAVTFPKTHDLQRLIDLVEEHGAPLGELSTFVDLNAFAVQYRYESLYSDEEEIDRKSMMESIDALIGGVAATIRSEEP